MVGEKMRSQSLSLAGHADAWAVLFCKVTLNAFFIPNGKACALHVSQNQMGVLRDLV